MSLLEILVVIAIMGLISARIAMSVHDQYVKAKKSTTEIQLKELRNIVFAWRENRGDSECPTLAQLAENRLLDAAAKMVDPWGMPYRIVCTEIEVYAISAGGDKQENTDDDLSVPDRKGRGFKP